LNKINNDIKDMLQNGNSSDAVKDYVKWYSLSEASRVQYRNDLDVILLAYQRENPNETVPPIGSMTIEQLNELDKKFQNPNYDLNLR
jgi:hypothetical protein